MRGLLDFNRVFGRYPDALPATAGAYPRDPPGAAFTLLREGDAWLDEEHNLLLAVDKVVDCTAPAKVRDLPQWFPCLRVLSCWVYTTTSCHGPFPGGVHPLTEAQACF